MSDQSGTPRLGPAAAPVVVGLKHHDVADLPRHGCGERTRGNSCRNAGRVRRRPTAPCFGAVAQVSRTERTPGASTAHGFSAKTCFPASTAAFRCSGRKCGGVTQEHHVAMSDHVLVGIEADELGVRFHIDARGDLFLLEQVWRGFSPGDPRRRRPWRPASRSCRLERVDSGPGAAIAATDEADADDVVAACIKAGAAATAADAAKEFSSSRGHRDSTSAEVRTETPSRYHRRK